MAKIDLNFNNKNYSIDESSLSAASAALKSHLSTVMNGTGATVNFGGTAYGIDSAKLATATNDFVTHLGTVAGNGYKVKVGGVEYGVDSAKMTGAVGELEAVLGGLNSGNDKLAAGLYKNGVMTKSWDELIDEGIIIVEDSTISSCADRTIAGDLVVHNSVTSIGYSAFSECTALTSVDLPVATSIDDNAFSNCANLSALILRNAETVCQIIVTSVLGTKIVTAEGAPTGEGFIYVPSALYEGYVELIAMQAEQMIGDAATAEYIARAVLRKIEDYPEIANPDSGYTPTDEILEGDGQEFHKFAPTALTFRSTAPLNELQEVQINGVTVDPSNYTLEEGSTVITLLIEYLQTLDVDNYEITVVSDSKSAKGGFSVVLPDINTYKFYYDQPYVGEVPTVGKVTAIFYENNIADVIMADNTISATSVEYGEGTINIPTLGVTCIVNDNGTEIYIPEFGATLILMWERTDGGVNEHGLYYNKPYVYNGEAFVFFEDGNVSYYTEGRLQFGGSFTPEYNDNTFYLPLINITGIINSDGTEISIPSLSPDAIYVLSDDYIYQAMKVNIGDYEYEYTTHQDYTYAWCVKVMDRRKSSYGTIKSEIKGIPVATMAHAFEDCTSLTTAPVIPDGVTDMIRTFQGCTSLTTAPVIPDGVTDMGGTFQDCTSLTTAPVIPDGVTDMGGTFKGCTSLTTAPVIPNSVKSMQTTFYNCVSLAGTIIINASLRNIDNQADCNNCFTNTVKDIVLTGSSANLNSLAYTANNGNVTVQ